jgi:hypothetical protein
MESEAFDPRHYPIPQTPPGWALNDIFLRMLEAAKARWDAAGYDWKFGMEISFDLQSPRNFKWKPDQENPLWAAEDAQNAHFEAQLEKMHARGRDTTRARKAVTQMRAEADAIAAMHGISVETVIAQLDQIDADLRSRKPAVKEDGMQNAYMAWIHTRNYDQGGVFDLIEPRFGDYLHGMGWWDSYQHGELRTQILSDPLDVIEKHHKMIEILSTTAHDFNLMAHFLRGHAPQIHYSIWDRASGQNMMDFNDDTLDFRTRLATGILDWVRHAPYMFQDMHFSTLGMQGQLDFDSWRVENGIRQCEGHWELRRSCSNMADNAGEIGYMARDLAMLMAQSLPAILPEADNRRSDFILDQYFVDPPNTHLITRHIFGNKQHMLTAMLGHARIRDDGTMYCPHGLFPWAIETLQRSVGKHALGDFKHRRDEKEPLFDLSKTAGWEYLFKSIRYEDGKLVTDHLSPEVAVLFDEVEVLGTRKVLTSMPLSMSHDSTTLLQLNERFRPLAAQLPDILSEDDWVTIRDHYHDLLERYLNVYCHDMVKKLAATFRDAAGDVEDPKEMILDLVGSLRRDSANMTTQTMLAETRPDHDESEARDQGRLTRAATDASPLERLEPCFAKAVAAEIELERAAAHPDNRQIAFLEATRSYTNDNFRDFADTIPHTFGTTMVGVIRRIEQERLDITTAELVAIMHPVLVMSQVWESFRRFDFESEAVLAHMAKDRAAWNEYWAEFNTHYADTLAKHPLAAYVCEKIGHKVDVIFDDLARMARNLGKDDQDKEPPKAKPAMAP